MRIKHPRNKSPDIIRTVYINTATKRELFTEIVNTEPLNFVYPPQVISPLTFNHRKLIKEEKDFEFKAFVALTGSSSNFLVEDLSSVLRADPPTAGKLHE
jgi:hypothetical protein